MMPAPPPPRTKPGPLVGLPAGQSLPPLNTVYVNNTATDKQLLTGVGQVTNATMLNLAATVAAKVILYDGTDTTGDIIGGLGAAAGFGDDFGPGWPGVPFRRGIFMHIISGTVTVSVTYAPQINHW